MLNVNLKPLSIFVILICSFSLAIAQTNSTKAKDPVRQIIPLNDNWDFHFAYDVRQKPISKKVNLPYTWNAHEVMNGQINYERTTGIYKRKLTAGEDWKDKRLFLYFEGANSVADVLVNQHYVGEHRGGYTAFCMEITGYVQPGQNLITVQVSNAYRLDVLPLSGDFNVYGGLHRPVSLIITEKNCISPLDYASSGVYLTPKNVSEKSAEVEVLTKLSLQQETVPLQLKTSILDEKQMVIAESITPVNEENRTAIQQHFTIQQPHLWNGKSDPYLYKAKVELVQDNQTIDAIVQPLGLRYYKVDPEKGFFLNGKYLDLHGLGRHEDVQGKGSALTNADYDRDMELINEIGATTMRLTHYPHGNYFYDLCDKNGLVLWTEIPLVGPGGYTGAGYVKNKDLEDHAKQVLTELIRQHYNHPSIFFWSLFNELKLDYDDPLPFVKELNALAKKEDPMRLTTCASFLDNDKFNEASDLIAWNKYYGWYGGRPEQIGAWADETHQKFPQKSFAISEYGAGASIWQHSDSLKQPNPSGKFHPEEWQAYYHEKNWEALSKRPFIWGKYVWVLADFGSSIRNEGDTVGINDKGLVTYNRSIKKDAFYFYKANWNPSPMIYITDRRYTLRTQNKTSIKIYTNQPQVELFVNGISMGKKTKDDLNRITWGDIILQKGNNTIKVQAKNKRVALEDSCEWVVQ